MEFIAKLPANLPEIIENNGEEVKVWLSQVLEKYDGIVVTPETVRSAKEDKASLNKLRAALEERRKEVKRDYLAPYQRFEVQYKEILALIDKPITVIDSQIRALDEQEQQAKYDRLQEFFQGCCKRMENGEAIRFDSILNPKWRNKTQTEHALQKEIADAVVRIDGELNELRDFYADSPHYTAILNAYLQGYDKSCALAYAAALVQQEQRQRAAQQPVREPEQITAQVSEPVTDPTVQETPAPSPAAQKLYTGMFRVTGTKEQIIMLRDWMRRNHIQFESVKEK